MEFNEKVKHVRQWLSLSQSELALKLGVDYCTVNKWENGVYKPQPEKERIFNSFCNEHHIDFNELSAMVSALEKLNIELSVLEEQKALITERIKQTIERMSLLVKKFK